MSKSTITTTIEITPEQLTTIIKAYFKEKKNLEVTTVRYGVSDTSDDRFGGFPSYNLSKVEIINEVSEQIFI